MERTLRNVVVSTLAVAALLAFSACSKPAEEAPNPKPPAPAKQPPAQQQQPSAAPAPAAQQPAAQEPAAAAAPAAAAEPSPEAMAEAKKTFDSVCVTCHGSTGHGDGPAAAGFPVKPRSFSDAEWQKSVTDEHIAKVIVQGGPAVGKSPLMPGNPQLADKPEVVNALVKIIRDFGKQG